MLLKSCSALLLGKSTGMGDNPSGLGDIPYNPVKHGLAASPAAWLYSTLKSCVERWLYPLDWIGANLDPAQAGKPGARASVVDRHQCQRRRVVRNARAFCLGAGRSPSRSGPIPIVRGMRASGRRSGREKWENGLFLFSSSDGREAQRGGERSVTVAIRLMTAMAMRYQAGEVKSPVRWIRYVATSGAVPPNRASERL